MLAAAALAAVVAGFALLSAHYGSPASVVRKTWSSFSHEAGSTNPNNLNSRLFSFSGTGRVDLWRVAWSDFRAHPLLGSGAGTYQRYWLQDRPVPSEAVNAHNLYAETLAELGLPGLGLLLLALLAPLVAAVRARRLPVVGAAAAAYAALLVHAIVDWDWQLPGVALAGVLLGAGVLVAGRDESRSFRLPRPVLGGAIGALVLVAVVSVVTLLANRAVANAGSRTASDDIAAATSFARRAQELEPWSSEPWRVLGEAQLADGRLAAAQATFHTAIAKNPGSWKLWLDLALASRPRRRIGSPPPSARWRSTRSARRSTRSGRRSACPRRRRSRVRNRPGPR